MKNNDKTAGILLLGLESILENSLDMIFIKDLELNYLAASKAFADLVGFKSGRELVGKTDGDIFDADLARSYTDDDKKVLASGMPITDYIERLPDQNGKKSYSSTSKYALKAESGEIIGLCGIARDVTAQLELDLERENSELSRKMFADVTEQLKIAAGTDPLTGLLNRKSTMEQIQSCINDGGGDKCHVLLFIDLDCFKEINDQLGHPYGDTVLRKIAARLKLMFCDSDIVGRIGGDEFLVLLKNISDEGEIRQKANSLFNAIPLYSTRKNGGASVTCSIGASIYRGGKTVEQLYDEADKAMYEAKRKGKNCLAFYKDECL